MSSKNFVDMNYCTSEAAAPRWAAFWMCAYVIYIGFIHIFSSSSFLFVGELLSGFLHIVSCILFLVGQRYSRASLLLPAIIVIVAVMPVYVLLGLAELLSWRYMNYRISMVCLIIALCGIAVAMRVASTISMWKAFASMLIPETHSASYSNTMLGRVSESEGEDENEEVQYL